MERSLPSGWTYILCSHHHPFAVRRQHQYREETSFDLFTSTLAGLKTPEILGRIMHNLLRMVIREAHAGPAHQGVSRFLE